ncbi:hypothetical protein A1351_05705 [Methylosinus sp. R-45379]|jgi:uncharacterized protein (DUF983 family)|uniref:DUF983 domain-containing protein n=1 Tax=unclassified Methylosinus TaxID=2624500 RepID=UPI00046729B5|nr:MULTISPECIES: DUF983 domain-containing protein [unclassified Methylosinus]OAI31359.1 hypothetical protein A1351_05705 [Methylosinus sp. R-45379]TDX62219.1 uncharacterized protein (DUF983 family) [Methylosinus sp. sav-2]
MAADEHSTVNPYVAGLLGRCPRCGKGHLFRGFLTLAPSCEVCGLDLAFADSGDGPAVFVMTIAGFIVVGAALYVEVAYSPPYWVHGLIFLPLTVIVCAGLLRPAKSLLIALQYFNKAEEGQRADES